MTEEANEVIRLGLAPGDLVRSQRSFYCSDGFDAEALPQKILTTTGLMVFANAAPVVAFMELWRQQIERWTIRDQLSVDYCAWKTGVGIGYLPGHYRDNDFVHYDRQRHRSRRSA